MKNLLIAISGPSGVGKGTVVNELLKRDSGIVTSISCTTRAMRVGEVDKKDYFFITREEFEDMIRADGFIEYDEHFGNYYGTPRAFVEEQLKQKSVILEIDVNGALNAKRIIPSTVLIMIVPPSLEELKTRLSGRGTEDEGQIKGRLERVNYELSLMDEYDYVVVNDEIESAVQKVADIIEKEKNR